MREVPACYLQKNVQVNNKGMQLQPTGNLSFYKKVHNNYS
jgi:hypothetical protein